MRERIPLPMADETHLLLGLSAGDAGVLFGGLAVALGILAPHAWERWPEALATAAGAAGLLVRRQGDPLWRWALAIAAFYMAPRRFRFDIPSEVNPGEASGTALVSPAGHRQWDVPHGSGSVRGRR